jgi:N,N'-diacetyllegionaminate synthase
MSEFSSSSNQVLVIAEAGVNHNGSIEHAHRLIDVAKAGGADAVKFQTFSADLTISKQAPKAEYQKAATGSQESQWEMVKRLELTSDNFAELARHCSDVGIEFMSTPFDIPSVKLLESLGMKRFKVASGEIVNLRLLRAVARTGRPIILSTGMASTVEIEQALAALDPHNSRRDQISILHCNTEYPTPLEDANVRAVPFLQNYFNMVIGYSDHTLGFESSLAAVALGAKIIEKHFTLDKAMEGPDHQASLNPDELKEFVQSIRKVSISLGRYDKRPTNSEMRNIPIARKSIVAARAIQKGEQLDETNLEVKRPGTGISPMRWDDIVGKRATRAFAQDELIEI